MHAEEFAALARAEGEHWFYSGKREIAARWLLRGGPLRPDDLLLDVGAGTGLFAAEMRRCCRVLAIDPDATALGFIRARDDLPAVAASAEALPIETGTAAALSALDVIEHLDDDHEALCEFTRVVRPGGAIIITVPALPLLWSEWDVALHHRRRYTRRSLDRTLRGLPVQIIHLSYINTVALPPILVYRALRGWGLRLGGRRLEDQVPAEPLNSILRRAFVTPALWRVRAPVGVSLLCLLRRL